LIPLQEDETAVHKKTDNVSPDDYQPEQDADVDDVEPDVDDRFADDLETEAAVTEDQQIDGVDERATADVQVLNNMEMYSAVPSSNRFIKCLFEGPTV
jgi:hypothetical protein